MSNPFLAKFNSDCQSCGSTIEEGEDMFSHDGLFICEECANGENVVCDCGNYKKPEYDECFECHEQDD